MRGRVRLCVCFCASVCMFNAINHHTQFCARLCAQQATHHLKAFTMNSDEAVHLSTSECAEALHGMLSQLSHAPAGSTLCCVCSSAALRTLRLPDTPWVRAAGDTLWTVQQAWCALQKGAQEDPAVVRGVAEDLLQRADFACAHPVPSLHDALWAGCAENSAAALRAAGCHPAVLHALTHPEGVPCQCAGLLHREQPCKLCSPARLAAGIGQLHHAAVCHANAMQVCVAAVLHTGSAACAGLYARAMRAQRAATGIVMLCAQQLARRPLPTPSLPVHCAAQALMAARAAMQHASNGDSGTVMCALRTLQTPLGQEWMRVERHPLRRQRAARQSFQAHTLS